MTRFYRIRIQPKTGFMPYFDSDTLFGHLAWTLLYTEGEASLTRLLDQFRTAPPFRLSSVFPAGFVPRPELPLEHWTDDADLSLSARMKQRERGKQLRKRTLVSLATLLSVQNGLSSASLARALTDRDDAVPPITVQHEASTAVDRQSGRALDGSLHNTRARWLAAGASLESWLRIDDDSIDASWLAGLFAAMGEHGLGADASTGRGQAEITLETPEDEVIRGLSAAGSHFISLSHTAGSDLVGYAWTPYTKYGRLGGAFSSKGIDGVRTVFKKPIILYRHGSTFCAPSPFGGQGSMLGGLVPDERVLQYAWAMPLPCTISGESTP